MAFNVSDFKAKMGNDGLRPNLFEVSIAQSGDGGSSWNPAGTDLEFHCRAASIPGSTTGTVIVPYFGREVKFAGNRTFGDVTLTVINDEDMGVRNKFEKWMEALSKNEGNTRVINSRSSNGAPKYFATTTIKPLSKFDGLPIIGYQLESSFPTDLSEITLDWGDNDSIAEFTVTMAYDFYSTTPGLASSRSSLSLIQ